MIKFDWPRLDAAERKFAAEHGMWDAPPAQVKAAMFRASSLAETKYATSPALARALAPRPIVELAGCMFLHDRDRRRLFADHDAGDEDASARRYARFVCALAKGFECSLDPHHIGPHEWQVSQGSPPCQTFSVRPFKVPTGRHELDEAAFFGEPMHEVDHKPHAPGVGTPCYACVVERRMHDPGDEG